MYFSLAKAFALALVAGTTLINCEPTRGSASIEKRHLGGFTSLARRPLDVPIVRSANIEAREVSSDTTAASTTEDAAAGATSAENTAQGGQTKKDKDKKHKHDKDKDKKDKDKKHKNKDKNKNKDGKGTGRGTNTGGGSAERTTR
ncbi:uncharacterized protein AB675_7937 [Cyphellophora attinorum]|uniref:Uncharacterized protein n=1 Tax=Cyphellophora attinorum TaxID=1664694 RepID=A0A0N0NN63_9EURO|nr:uncharacterized protein AB675_7937 [Phialophora attinorum]KPI41009.1 hypothetical protein AB675_7937 [Phialophora attinorum]